MRPKIKQSKTAEEALLLLESSFADFVNKAPLDEKIKLWKNLADEYYGKVDQQQTIEIPIGDKPKLNAYQTPTYKNQQAITLVAFVRSDIWNPCMGQTQIAALKWFP